MVVSERTVRAAAVKPLLCGAVSREDWSAMLVADPERLPWSE